MPNPSTHGSSSSASSTPAKPRVVIAGAGVAGMAAAQVLIDAGVDVIVLEKSSAPGGKCSSYVDPELGHTVEHGIHGVFPRYENLARLWRDVGIDDAIFRATKTTGMAGPDRTMHVTELAKVKGPAPFFLLTAPPSGVLRLRDYLFSARFLARTYAARWKSSEMLDETTFGAMLRTSGVPTRMIRLLLGPYLRNLAYAREDEVSAEAASSALNYYVIEGADDVKARFFDGGPCATVFVPWQKELEKRGVVFRCLTPVQQILMNGDHFVGFGTESFITDKELGDQPKLFTRTLGHHFLALNWQPATKTLRAFDGHCTHRGCEVAADLSANPPCLTCPCHGGQFSADGAVLKAPPTQPLAPVPMKHDATAGVWIVEESGGGGGGGAAHVDTDKNGCSAHGGGDDGAVEEADVGILAMDLAALKALLPRELVANASTQGIPELRTTSVMVLRMRFQARAGQTRFGGPDSGVFAADDFLDNFFALHTFQKEFEKIDDLFLECHVGSSEAYVGLTSDDIYDRALAVLDAYFPNEGLSSRLLRDKSRILRHDDVFPLFAPGDYVRTPTVSDSRRPNLMLAGDWVRTDDPEHRAWYLERAAVTGIEAANAALRQLGLASKMRTITSPASPAVSRLVSLPFRAWSVVRSTMRGALGLDDP